MIRHSLGRFMSPVISLILDGQHVVVKDDNGERTLRIARVCVMLPWVVDMAAVYINDMLSRPYRLEISNDVVEVFFQDGPQEFNLSDQMIRIGLALPCAF